MAGKGQRLDVFLHVKGFFESRERARAAIMAGQVKVDGIKAEKCGINVGENAQIEIAGGMPYVSRGGLKLEKALQSFQVDLKGKVMLDVGASTGGFTDCALQNGATRVYAVDVGYGQLAWKLRTDTRVVVLERTNIRKLKPEVLEERPDFITIDVSFISLAKVMPHVAQLADRQARGIALIKPQFEAGRDKVGKRGVIRDPAVHRQVLFDVYDMMEKNGWGVLGMDFSPIRGPEGNIEYLMYFDLSGPGRLDRNLIPQVVAEANSKI